MITAVVAVRKGSQRVPNKNIKPFGESNLLEMKLKVLLQVNGIDEIVVNSDAYLQLSETDMETLKVFQQSIDAENEEVIAAYNTAKTKKANGSDKVDAEVVEEVSEDSPEKVLAT